MLDYYPLQYQNTDLFRRAGVKDFGTYVHLCMYAAQQNLLDGRIRGCKKWKRRDWIHAVGIENRPKNDSLLYEWEDDDLVIACFNSEPIIAFNDKSQKCSNAAHSMHKKRKEREQRDADARADAHADAHADSENAQANTEQMHVQNNIKESNKNENKINEKGIESSAREKKSTDDSEEVDRSVLLRQADSVDAVKEVMREAAPGIDEQQLDFIAMQFYEKEQANGWTMDGQPLRNWPPAARKYIRAVLEKQSRKPKSTREGLAPGETDRNRNIY